MLVATCRGTQEAKVGAPAAGLHAQGVGPTTSWSGLKCLARELVDLVQHGLAGSQSPSLQTFLIVVRGRKLVLG